MLERAVEDTVKAGGTLMIPTFALERTQEMLYHLHQLFQEGRIPRVPVFIDSPLAIKLTAIYKKYENYFNTETQHIARRGDDILNFPGLRLTLTTEQSKEINDVTADRRWSSPAPACQTAAASCITSCAICPIRKAQFYSSAIKPKQSLGRQILDGATEVHIFGETVPVRCKVTQHPRLFCARRPAAPAPLAQPHGADRSKKCSSCKASSNRARCSPV